MLTINNLTKKGEGNFTLSGITFTQRKLEKIAVAGETGAGKSTLLKLIAGLIQPDGGQLLVDGERVMGPEDQLVPGHPGIAYLSQHFELQKSLRVEQVLDYSNTLSERTARALYRICQIDHLLKRRTDQLSGGEKQRVAICRLLISNPQLLLLDEPFSHLDMEHKITLKTVIDDIGKKLKITCMLVSHDPLDTLSWADRILIMKEGRIVQEGTPDEIYNTPVNAYAGGLFGKYNLINRTDFRIFSKIPAIGNFIRKTGAANVFLRPEQFRIARKNPRALRAKAENVLYFGSHQEVHVRIADVSVIVKSQGRRIREGDTVYIAAPGAKLWSI